VYPLYGLLPPEQQRAAIAPSPAGSRKVVLATPIAETSLTIEGVRVVVDGGFCRRLVFDPQNALSRLETVRISRDMADQRSGRAGRVAPGVCYRLWNPATEARMAPTRVPEILEADLAGTVLDAAAWGESQPERLAWLTPPPAAHVAQAKQLLKLLGAISDDGRITPHGRALAALPCHPRIAQMLIADFASLKGCTTEGRINDYPPARSHLAAEIAALLEERDPLAAAENDASLTTRLEALHRAGRSGHWGRIAQMAEQYRKLAAVPAAAGRNSPGFSGGDAKIKAAGMASADPFTVGWLVAEAYPERVAKARPEGRGHFQLAGGELAAVRADDPLSACEWLAVASLSVRPGGEGRIFLAAPLDPEDVPALIRTRDRVAWDGKAGAALAQRERRIGGLLLDAKPLSEGVREQLTQAICDAAKKEERRCSISRTKSGTSSGAWPPWPHGIPNWRCPTFRPKRSCRTPRTGCRPSWAAPPPSPN
jgi:HrpA-like helicases